MKQLAAIAFLLAVPAAAQDFLEPPAYLVAVWDGRPTAPGLWFTLDGRLPDADTRLALVDRLADGVTIDASPADLRVSAALASHLGLRPGAPALFEIGRIAPPPPTPRTVAAETTDAATDYADGHARVTALLEELRSAAAETVAAGYNASPTTSLSALSTVAAARQDDAPPAPAAPALGGLVALDPRAWP